jgi:general secretion pathway protein D
MRHARSVTMVVLVALLCCERAAAQGEVEFLPSAATSLSAAQRLLEVVELRALLPLGYVHREDLRGTGTLGNAKGVLAARVYARSEAGVELHLGLAIVRGVSGGYDLALAAEPSPAGDGRSTRDMPEVRRRVQQLLVAQQSSGPREPDVAQEMVQLGHIEARHALSLLKALGYSTLSLEEAAAAPPVRRSGVQSRTGTSAGRGTQMVAKPKPEQGLPLVIHVSNATKTSLMETVATGVTRAGTATSSQQRRSGGLSRGAPQLGGTHLHSATAGAPEERLLIVYDRNDPESLERLLSLLQTQIDVGARQIVIEALVVELNTTMLRDLGVEFQGGKEHVQASFEQSSQGADLPFTFLFSRDGMTDFLSFRTKLEALAESGNAEVLSSPSVLVLNDRQARIQVGQQVPVVRSTTTSSTTTSSVEYFPIGIVLNLRPRISPGQAEVTLQIETIISSISETSATSGGGSSQVAFAPVVDNRTVETFVRVADGTPFIIGGLLSTENRTRRVGIPLISRVPVLGRLFSRETAQRDRREVIVVITPHIVPDNDRSFSYLIPKDSDLFNRFDTQLFRNAYRVRDDDVWDLEFIRESPVRTALLERVSARVQEDITLRRQEPFRSLLEGRIAGEDVLVRRMIYEIIDQLRLQDDVDPSKIFFFRPAPAGTTSRRFEDVELAETLGASLQRPESATVLSFRPGAVASASFALPLAEVRDTTVAAANHEALLWDLNVYSSDAEPEQQAIVVGNKTDLRRLSQVLILKQVLDLNKNLPLTLDAFKPGTHILFPSRDDMRNRFHVVDEDVARMFYETVFYYQAAERQFDRTVREVEARLGGGATGVR